MRALCCAQPSPRTRSTGAANERAGVSPRPSPGGEACTRDKTFLPHRTDVAVVLDFRCPLVRAGAAVFELPSSLKPFSSSLRAEPYAYASLSNPKCYNVALYCFTESDPARGGFGSPAFCPELLQICPSLKNGHITEFRVDPHTESCCELLETFDWQSITPCQFLTWRQIVEYQAARPGSAAQLTSMSTCDPSSLAATTRQSSMWNSAMNSRHARNSWFTE
jgi:hypothetical protein